MAKRKIDPCPSCGSTKLACVPNVQVELWVQGSHHSEKDPSLDLVVCIGCGLTRLFARDPASFVRNFESSFLIEASGRAPYR